MSKKIDILPLEELYDRPKITPAVAKQILLKEDFTKISTTYCSKVCTLPEADKCPSKQIFSKDKVDILIVYPFPSPAEKYRPGNKVDDIHKKVISALANKYFQGLSWGFTYALRCRPTDSKTSVTTIRKCTPYLVQEIASRSPKIVLGLGVDVGKALGLPKVPRGLPRAVQGLGSTFDLICTLHPKTLTMIRQNASGQFWGPDYLDIIRYDFQKAADVASGKVKVRDIREVVKEIKEGRIIIADSLASISRFTEHILAQAARGEVLVSWDTETSGLDPWAEGAKFLCHQFGFRDIDGIAKSFVIPLWHFRNQAYDPNQAWPYIQSILEAPNVVKVTHNGAFDIIYTRVTTGVRPISVKYDTMLLLHSKNSGMQGCYDLKTATVDWLFELQLGGYEDLMRLPEGEEVEEVEEEEESSF